MVILLKVFPNHIFNAPKGLGFSPSRQIVNARIRRFLNQIRTGSAMISTIISQSLVVQSSPISFSASSKLSASKTVGKRDCALLLKRNPTSHLPFSLAPSNEVLGFSNANINLVSKRGLYSICLCDAKDEFKTNFQGKEIGLDWPILKRWEVPWEWPMVTLTMIACGLSFVLTGLVETALVPYLGLQIGELSLDEKAEILFVDQAIVTAVVLGVVYGVTNTFQPRPDDFLRYEWNEPFNLQKGWLLWAGVGLGGALLSIALTGAAMAFFSGESPQRETDALVRLLPLIGSSSISTACLVGITGVLAPVLEETVFRGFLMVSLTKWFPTPVSVLLSAAVFALAHLTPGEFPQLFVLGTALGFSYAQTRNLLTPITIHALWNSGVILLLTFLQLEGYDIRELLQAN